MAQNVSVGIFTTNIVIAVAAAKYFFAEENVSADIHGVTDSATLLRNLIDGKYDIILANADNVVSWCEGQGADPKPNDLVVFLGGSRGVNQKLVVAPRINRLEQLRGQVFAVDAPTTGYAIVGIYIMKKHGLELSRDYTLQSFGNTEARAKAMDEGKAAAAMMGMADDEVERWGFRVAARAEQYVRHYARALGTTRREWAEANDDLLVRFSRAMIRANDWLSDRANEEEAIGLLTITMHRKKAEAIYSESLSADFGIVSRCRIDIEGIRGAMELRKFAGLMNLPVSRPEKYVDEGYYTKALATMKA